MGRSVSFASQSWVRFSLTLAIAATGVVAAMPACSSGDDFTGKATGGASATGGTAGDASTTGGSGGSGGVAGTATGGVAGTGTGGVAGAAGEAGSGGVAGSGGAAGDGGTGGNPGGKDNGQPCANKTECKSNYCVDDVCCESECNTECRSCKVSGKEGLCTPYAQGTDPEGECLGATSTSGPCSGTCDGKGVCDYPDGSTSCGAQVCTNATKSTFACDNAGACKKNDVSCGLYQCSGVNCLTNCTQDSQCVTNNYCSYTVCSPKLSLGAICPKNSACQSGNCVAGLCCSTACGANFTCVGGSCECDGATCAAGEACSYWYQDADGDGFGNKGAIKLGCASKQPTGYVANDTDCDDGDFDAKPGQTKFFTTPRKGKGGYDYNCDNNQEKYYGVVTDSSCKVCANTIWCPLDTTPPCTSGSFGCTSPNNCPGVNMGFNSDVACGVSAILKTCQQSSQIQGAPPYTEVCISSATPVPTPNTPQPCR